MLVMPAPLLSAKPHSRVNSSRTRPWVASTLVLPVESVLAVPSTVTR